MLHTSDLSFLRKLYPLRALALTVLFVSELSQAECHVPDGIDRKVFINAVDPHYSPQNPNAGTIMELTFNNGRYLNKILTKNITAEGHYRYQKLSDTIGLITATENFGGEVTKYTLLLNCLSDYSGTAVYTQTQGAIKPDNRQNTARYTIKQ